MLSNRATFDSSREKRIWSGLPSGRPGSASQSPVAVSLMRTTTRASSFTPCTRYRPDREWKAKITSHSARISGVFAPAATSQRQTPMNSLPSSEPYSSAPLSGVNSCTAWLMLPSWGVRWVGGAPAASRSKR